MSTELEKFAALMRKTSKDQIPIHTEWCKVKEVDWEDKTMTATSLLNGLDYFDILLGLGSIYKRPKVDVMTLIGFIANTKSCFMIDCEAFEEMVIVSDQSSFTIKEDGFIIIQSEESLKEVLNNLIENISRQNEQIKNLSGFLQKVIVVNGTSPDIPGLVALDQTLAEIKQDNDTVNDRLNTILIE